MTRQTEKLIPYSLKASAAFWSQMDECIRTQSYYADKHPGTKADFIRNACEIYMRYHARKIKPAVLESRRQNDPLAFFISTADGIERF